jgi:hypothetical protein
MANARNLLVINDEAHHAWRVNWEAEPKSTAYAKQPHFLFWSKAFCDKNRPTVSADG